MFSRFLASSVRVALLAEGVDRNCKMLALVVQPVRSPSSQRAWIEIFA